MKRRVAATPPGSTTRRDIEGEDVRLLTLSSYVAPGRGKRHLFATSTHATFVAVAVWLSVLVGERMPRLSDMRWWGMGALCVFMVVQAPRWCLLLVLCLVGAAGGAAAWSADVVIETTECNGVGYLRSDPSPLFGGTRATVELHGMRFSATAHGAAGSRLTQRSAGESVMVRGTCSPLTGDFARSNRVRHIVGTLTINDVSEHFAEGSIVLRAANRIRDAMQQGVGAMGANHKSLFTGLVIGDDRLQPREMVQRFRDSGLSHLCAASGQNVAYLLAVATPFMRRRNARTKWLLTLCIIGCFIVLTRAEPSVLRAGFMAGAVATNALRQRPMNARAVLAVSVICLLMIDPMLAWSIGFALSVGATAGLAWLSAPLGKICGGRGVLASTLAAQLGTFPVSLAVFGSVPVVSLVANPLALPVAGAVMTVGLPLSLLATTFPWLVGPVSLVLTVPVAWVDGVAHIASRVSPTGHVNAALWIAVALWVAGRWVRKKGGRPTAVAG